MRGWLLRWFPFATRAGRAFGERFTPLGKWLLATCAIAGIFSADPTRTHAYLLFAGTAALLLVAFALSLLWRPRFTARRLLPPAFTADTPGEYGLLLRQDSPRDLHELRLADRLRLRYPTRAEFDLEVAGVKDDNWFDRRVGFLRWQRLRQRLQGAVIATLPVAELPAGADQRLTLGITPLRRGWLEFDALRVLMPEPLGLCYSIRTLPLTGRVLSRPVCVPMPALRLPGSRPQGSSAASRRGDGLEFFALRDYRPGDPPKHIDWRSSARRGQPVVRQFATEASQAPLIVFDCSPATGGSAAFETLVTVAGSLLTAMAHAGAAASLALVHDTLTTPLLSSLDEALDCLAIVTPAADDCRDATGAFIAREAGTRALCVLSAAWDATRADAAARRADTLPWTLTITTDPLARGGHAVFVITDPARDLPALGAWLASAGRRERSA